MIDQNNYETPCKLPCIYFNVSSTILDVDQGDISSRAVDDVYSVSLLVACVFD